MRHSRLAAAGGALLLLAEGGCASRGITPRQYVLTAIEEEAGASADPIAVSVGVGPVRLPRYLDRPQIVTREGGNRLAGSELHEWAEDLESGFARVLGENLARLVPSDRVTVYPWGGAPDVDYRVRVVVQRFERGADGVVQLEATWSLLEKDGTAPAAGRRSSVRESVEGPDPTATVEAMSRAVAALAREIAEEIRAGARGSTFGP